MRPTRTPKGGPLRSDTSPNALFGWPPLVLTGCPTIADAVIGRRGFHVGVRSDAPE